MGDFGLGNLFAFIVIGLSLFFFDVFPRGKFESEAIENNAAYYACDDKSGDCVFTWGKP